MNPDQLSQILSSRVRLKIADSLSQRPRTLGELANITGISVQGVLRHLRRMERLGLIEERRVSADAPKARIVYAAKGSILEDYSSGELVVAKAVERWPPTRRAKAPTPDLEGMAAEVLLRRRRV
ncbi:MAG TPA: winged helix-turn-helix domain-containing protein, partial [Nitrososphaerales archaeon]|nr:winged helix-turn-helix domain-containing protein [Nitrososphaerales archaeon]